MSTNDTYEEDTIDPIADAILHGGESDYVPDLQDDTSVEEPAELLLGKFKSADDMAEAYQNLEREFTQARQRATDLESLLQDDSPEEDARPVWNSSFSGGNPTNEEELVSWAQNDPGAAAQWAIANNDRVPEETVKAVWEHWFEQKPTDAMAWYTHQQSQSVAQQYEAELASLREQIAPLRDQQTATLFESSIASLEDQIPDLADYSQKIQDYIDNIPVDQLHLAFFPQGMDTPERIQEGVRSLYAIVRMRENPINYNQQAPTQDRQNAFTQSRQGVMDTNSSDYAAKINAAILNG